MPRPQATALVHEAYVRLVDSDVPWQNRAHFFAIAASTMRRLLVDHARSRSRTKRGGDVIRTSLDEALVVSSEPRHDLLDLDLALGRLAEQDERLAKAVEVHYFGGLSYQDTAKVFGVSPATIHRDLRLAKAWLRDQMSEPDGGAA